MRKSAMFIKLIESSFRKRKSRIAIALFAIVVGTAVVSGLVSVYYDINQKMGKELRSYGANLVVTPNGSGQDAKSIALDEIYRVAAAFPQGSVIAYTPYLYNLARVDDSQRLVVAGTWFDQVPKINPYWKVTGAIPGDRNASGSALIGAAVADKMKLAPGSTLLLQDEAGGGKQQFTVAAVVESGSTEDNQIFVSLQDAEELFGQKEQASAAYYSILRQGTELVAPDTASQFPQLTLSPIKQISSSEAVILDKIRSLVYLVVIIILLSTLLCVATTMMTMIMERKQEIALKKALGASNKALTVEFLSEGGMLGVLGAFFGLLLGYALAQIIGQSVFHSSIAIHAGLIPMVILMALGVAWLASLAPLKTLARIEPAVVLKGE